MKETGIEWTDSTWNPIRGCSPVSPGCKNCYAAAVARRFSGPGGAYEGLVRINARGERTDDWSGEIRFVEERLLDPLKWRTVLAPCVQCGKTKTCTCKDRDIAGPIGPLFRPRRIFVNSMSDLFHENVRDEWIAKIVAVMIYAFHHTYQVLTKRPQRMRALLSSEAFWPMVDAELQLLAGAECVGDFLYEWPCHHIWWGVSCEDQATAEERLPLLLQTPAAKRFISAEPLLATINLKSIKWETAGSGGPAYVDVVGGTFCTVGGSGMKGPALDWVICGGESGPGARPMRSEWALGLRDQCAAASVPFFFKRWGEWLGEGQEGDASLQCAALNCSDDPVRVGKKKAGALLDGREWREFPDAG